MKSKMLSILLVLLLTACADAPGPAADRQALEQIILDIKAGWEAGDGTPFRQHYLNFPGARYVESGGQNQGLDDLVVHHVEPEKDALEYLKLDIAKIETHIEDDFAWAVTDIRVQAKVRSSGLEIDKTGFGTWVFKRIDGQWKVVHTHSSTRVPRKPKATPEHSHSSHEH